MRSFLCVLLLFKVIFIICHLTFTWVYLVWSIVLRYILKYINYWVKKKKKNMSTLETTAANNGQKNKLALKSQKKMQTDKTGFVLQTQLKTKPRRILLKLNSKEMKFSKRIAQFFSICSAFFFLVVLWAFAAWALSNWWKCFLNLQVFFFYLQRVSFFVLCFEHLQHVRCQIEEVVSLTWMCFLKLQRVELSRPPY